MRNERGSNQQNRGRGGKNVPRRAGSAPHHRPRGGSSGARPSGNRSRSFKLNHDCDMAIISFLYGHHSALMRCALVCRSWTTAAIPLLWEAPMMFVLAKSAHQHDEYAPPKWKSFVTTSIACLADDAKLYLRENELALPAECLRLPMFRYTRFLRRYYITALEELCACWLTRQYGRERPMDSLLLNSLSSLFLENGRIDHVEFQNPYALVTQLKLGSRWRPSHITLQHNLADPRWQSLKLTSLTTRGDIDLDRWHGYLADSCRDLKRLEISELAGEDRLGLEKLISSQRGLEEISIDGRMSGSCVTGAWLTRSFASVALTITRIILKGELDFPVRALAPCINLRYLCIEDLHDTFAKRLHVVPTNTWPHLQTLKFSGDNGETLIGLTSAVGHSLTKLAVDRTGEKLRCSDFIHYLAISCHSLKELRIPMPGAVNLVLMFRKLPHLQHLQMGYRGKADDLFPVIIDEKPDALLRITFEGMYEMQNANAVRFIEWAISTNVTVVFDKRVKVSVNGRKPKPCKWVLENYIMQGAIRCLEEADLRRHWEL